jgi:hypothetical protein
MKMEKITNTKYTTNTLIIIMKQAKAHDKQMYKKTHSCMQHDGTRLKI